jgi:SAM-dependent methyltransferase
MQSERAFHVPAPDARQRFRRLAHAVLRRVGLLDATKLAVAKVLGNKGLRHYCTAGFTSGKVALGERNKYVLPIFPLDWIRVDIEGADYDLDLERGRPFPFADASQHILYSAHLVEHLDHESFEHFLKECERVLAPGGAIRIETPDAERLIQAYRQREDAVLCRFRENRRRDLIEKLGLPDKYLEDHLTVLGELSNYIDHRVSSGHIPVYATREEFDDKLNTLDLEALANWSVSLQTPEQLASGGHQNWMTWDKLRDQLLRAGFSRVVRAGFGETAIPGLKLNHGLASIKEKPHRAFYSVYVEAFK